MTDPNENQNRRTVLRSIAAGTATLAGLGAAGTATADHIPIGACARVIYDVHSWADCYNDILNVVIEGGTEGAIEYRCRNNSLVHFVPDDVSKEDGWIDDSYLEPC